MTAPLIQASEKPSSRKNGKYSPRRKPALYAPASTNESELTVPYKITVSAAPAKLVRNTNTKKCAGNQRSIAR